MNSEWNLDDSAPAISGFAEEGGKSAINDYRDLRVWIESVTLTAQIYEMTRLFPREEQFGLTSQMRRAAVSIPANIAEGYGRETTAAFINFLRIAQGSLKELETLTIVAQRVGILGAQEADKTNALTARIGKMLRAYIRSLAERRQS